jgi:hypothetical protein
MEFVSFVIFLSNIVAFVFRDGKWMTNGRSAI